MGAQDSTTQNDSTTPVHHPALLSIKMEGVTPSYIELENRNEANFGYGDIDSILKSNFISTSDAELNGAHSDSIDVGPTNTSDGVQSNRMEAFKIATDGGNVDSGSSVQNEGGSIKIAGRNAGSGIDNGLSYGLTEIHRITVLCPVKRNMGRAIDGGVSFICVVGESHVRV